MYSVVTIFPNKNLTNNINSYPMKSEELAIQFARAKFKDIFDKYTNDYKDGKYKEISAGHVECTKEWFVDVTEFDDRMFTIEIAIASDENDMDNTQKYAVVVSNKDDFIDSGVEVSIANNLESAKEYLKKVYDTCINQVNMDNYLHLTKSNITVDGMYAEIEWVSDTTHFSSSIIVKEVIDI